MCYCHQVALVTTEFGHQGPAYGKRPKSIINKLNKLDATRSFIYVKYDDRQTDTPNKYQIIINQQS